MAWAARTRRSPTPTWCSAICRPRARWPTACRSTASWPSGPSRAAVGEPLGLGVEEAAVAILRIANANMANALRVMTIARGHDPRRFALVAIGGAGPMHACALADELGIPRVVDPTLPGRRGRAGAARHRHPPRSAPQLAAADCRRSLPRTSTRSSRGSRPRPAALLETSASVTRSFEFSHELDMRYRGQAYNLTVPFAAAAGHGRDDRRRRGARSRRSTGASTTTRRASPRPTSSPCACARWHGSPTSTGRSPRTAGGPRSPAPAASTTAAGASGRHAGREALAQDDTIAAETIIEQEDTTVVIPPGWSGRVGAAGTLVLQRGAD